MIYAKIQVKNKTIVDNIYSSKKRLSDDLAANNAEALETVDFTIRGKTYGERKAAARDIAIDFQGAVSGPADIGLSWAEWADIGAFFETAARRYGLTDEYRGNGII